MDTPNRYRIDLDEEQLEIISKCLDMASRMYCGQLDTRVLFPLEDIIDYNRLKENEVSSYLRRIKALLFPKLGESHYGIGYNKKADRMYDMYKQIKHTINNQRDSITGKKSFNVHSEPPRPTTNHTQIEVTYLSTDILRDESLDKLID